MPNLMDRGGEGRTSLRDTQRLGADKELEKVHRQRHLQSPRKVAIRGRDTRDQSSGRLLQPEDQYRQRMSRNGTPGYQRYLEAL